MADDSSSAAGVNIHKEFKENSVAEFFKKNRQMLGYSGKIKSLTTAVHEYVTNSLDACEEAGILPEIFVELKRMGPDYYKLIVEDNGPGIPKKIVTKALGSMLAGTKFNRFQQARGQQGIGSSGVIMYSQTTTGKPTRIVTSQGDGTIYEVMISIDFKTNSAKIESEKEYPGKMRGLRLESELKDVKYQKGNNGVDEYLKRTVLVNPHTKLTFVDPENLTTVYDRAVDALPQIPKATLPHPKGLNTDDLLGYASNTKGRSVKSFLMNEFSRVSSAKVAEIQEKVSFDMEKRPQDLKWEEAEQIVKAIQQIQFIAPPTDVLIPVGQEQLEKALENILKPEFKTVITRPAAVYRGGVPFVVEIALAYGGQATKSMEERNEDDEEKHTNINIMRFSNRVPLLFDSGGCALTKAVNSIDWRRYDIKEDTPVVVIVNFTSIHVPYTGAGKEAIAEEEEIVKEIRLAIMDSARKLGGYVSGRRRASEKEAKKKILAMYVPIVAESLANMLGKDEKKIEKSLREIIEKKYEEIDAEGEEAEEAPAEEEMKEE